ncbi:polyribonucleotide nucleotidyltransferase [Patescibacteria group bacterium]|nr:polyribonucleotide nucleotidyltransferase [Patescibacteria group bacterium]
MQKKTYEIEVGGKLLTAEFNDLAPQASGSVMLRYGETVVLVTAVMGQKNVPMPYFPLSVEFEEKFYAAGAILGSRFVRREGKPSDEAVLSARIVDRTIRPLFPAHLRKEVQVVVMVLAIGEEDPDLLGIIGASLALGVSDIPWIGPVAAARVTRAVHSDVLEINANYSSRTEGATDFEVLACGRSGSINMIETSAREMDEATIIAALEAAAPVHAALEAWQKSIIAERGVPKRAHAEPQFPELLTEHFATAFHDRLYSTLFSGTTGKSHLYTLKDEFVASCATSLADLTPALCADFFEHQLDQLIHKGAVEEGKRADGRPLDAVREIFAQAGGVSPVLHGSGIFYRGETHLFSALTLGGPDAAQLVDTMEERDAKKRFMHHYNFPPFSVGEVGKVGGQNRRMIGHGALAEKALAPVIPKAADFPYTIRLVSETLSSNGSSSMASVCASTLALMDGGVPITRPVAGIASGVMFHNGKYALLTDIQGPEDEYGDMDFKVAGTSNGITAMQMDVKIEGVPIAILGEALEKARLARLAILAAMTTAIAAPRRTISPRAPEIVTLQILPEQIGLVIGGGGKTINSIKADAGVEEITIEEDGQIFITGRRGTAGIAADRIRALTRRYTVGERVSATITKLAPFGAFAKIDAYNDGLIHISEIADVHVDTVEGLLIVGETLPVIISKVENGKIGLSIKQADAQFYTTRTQP